MNVINDLFSNIHPAIIFQNTMFRNVIIGWMMTIIHLHYTTSDLTRKSGITNTQTKAERAICTYFHVSPAISFLWLYIMYVIAAIGIENGAFHPAIQSMPVIEILCWIITLSLAISFLGTPREWQAWDRLIESTTIGTLYSFLLLFFIIGIVIGFLLWAACIYINMHDILIQETHTLADLIAML